VGQAWDKVGQGGNFTEGFPMKNAAGDISLAALSGYIKLVIY